MANQNTPDLYRLLSSLSIPFERIQHPAIYTVEEARRLVPDHPAKAAKNLFLRDKKGKQHVLLAVEDHKSVSFSDIEKQTGLKRFSIASPDRLMRLLGVTPGAVSLLSLINDPEGEIIVLIDRALWQGDHIQAHPLTNNETLILSIPDMERFIAATRHAIQFVDVA